jgi:hypothetical protein
MLHPFDLITGKDGDPDLAVNPSLKGDSDREIHVLS